MGTSIKSLVAQTLQQIVTVLRPISKDNKLYVYTARGAIGFRGTSRQVSTAAWLIEHLDRPSGAAESQEYRVPGGPDDVIRVFYLPSGISPLELLGAMQAATHNVALKMRCEQARAIVVCGTTAEIAKADAVLQVTQTNKAPVH